jgi:HEAT repeat protein
VQAFGRNGESPKLLKGGLSHWSPLVRAAAIDAVVQVGPRAPEGTALAPLVQPLASDPDPAVVKKANAALARLK